MTQNESDVRTVFSILDRTEVLSILKRSLAKVKELIPDLSWDKTLRGLKMTHFDPDDLIMRYVEDKERLFTRAGMILYPEKNNSDSEKSDCQSCYNEIADTEKVSLECNHQQSFCIDCQRQYFRVMLTSRGNFMVQCMETGCTCLFEIDYVKFNIDIDLQEKLSQLFMDLYVSSVSNLRYCPGTNCSYVLQMNERNHDQRISTNVKCICSYESCFNCGGQDHEPVSCSMLEEWNLKNSHGEAETARWILLNTKSCPQCHRQIEKNGGCNHMTCPNETCRHEFCWLCLRNWLNHECAIFDPETQHERDQEMTSQERDRHALERYNTYWEMYMSLRSSKELEERLYSNINTELEELQKDSDEISWPTNSLIDLRNSVKSLLATRKFLKNAFIVCYYLKSEDNKWALLDMNLQDLHQAANCLLIHLESHIGNSIRVLPFSVLRSSVVSKGIYIKNRLSAIQDQIQELQ